MRPQRHSVIEPASLSITWEPLSFLNAPVSYGAYSYEVIVEHLAKLSLLNSNRYAPENGIG
jgi:hypothetical protein